MSSSDQASSSKSPTLDGSSGSTGALSPRQLQKSRAVVPLEEIHLDESQIDHDISLLISQYLHTRSNPAIASTFDEQVLGLGRGKQRDEDVTEVERAILDGEYGHIEALIGRPGLLKPQSQRAFLYLCYRQQFLEHIENRELQKAFNLLQKRLKPLEHYQPVPYDFYNLCYLTSAGTVHDAPGLKDWSGVAPEREKLVNIFKELTDAGTFGDDGVDGRESVPPGRLVTLLRQAVAWQVSSARRRGAQPWAVKSLLHDYSVRSVPNHLRLLVNGHEANIKCVDLIGNDQPHYGVSGSSDGTLRVFSITDGNLSYTLSGHTSRIWDCAVSPFSNSIASSSGDGSVRIWSATQAYNKGVLGGDGGDVYSVRWRPGREDQIVTASYDRILRSWDVETGQQIRTFSGHSQSTLAVAYDHTGNVLASGSKDKHIRLWDAIGGMCVRTISGSLGEITSVEFDADGKYLLAGCKDNSNRLWDLRMQRNLYRYTGHENTSKNLIRCSFGGAASDLIVGGSEDGNVYIWDREPQKVESRAISSAIIPSNNVHMSPVSPIPFGFASAPPISTNTLNLPTPELSPTIMMAKSSPAYYPPRTTKPAAKSAGVCVNIRPVQVLEGHERGAVFDVRWRVGELISGGEDGKVGLWTTVDEDEEI